MVMVVAPRVTSVCSAGLAKGLAEASDCLAGISVVDIWAVAGRAAVRVAAKARVRRSGVQREGFFMAVIVLPGC